MSYDTTARNNQEYTEALGLTETERLKLLGITKQVENTFIGSFHGVPGIQIVLTFVTKTCRVCNDTADMGVTYHCNFGKHSDVCRLCMPGVIAKGGNIHHYTMKTSPILEQQAAPKEKQQELLRELYNSVGVDHAQLSREILMDTPLPNWDLPDVVGSNSMNHYKKEARDMTVYVSCRRQHSDKEIVKYLDHLPGVKALANKNLHPFSQEAAELSYRNTKGVNRFR
jgi:hypothetical protein